MINDENIIEPEVEELNKEDSDKLKVFEYNREDQEKHFRFYEKLRSKIRDMAGKYHDHPVLDYVLMLPDFFMLLLRLLKDKDVPIKDKSFILALVGYVILPVDFIPDFIPVIGLMDDLLIVVYGLNTVIKDVDPAILNRHWSGKTNLLNTITNIIEKSNAFMSTKIYSKIKKWINVKRG